MAGARWFAAGEDPVVVIVIEIGQSNPAWTDAPLGACVVVSVLSHAAAAVAPLPHTEPPGLIAVDAPVPTVHDSRVPAPLDHLAVVAPPQRVGSRFKIHGHGATVAGGTTEWRPRRRDQSGPRDTEAFPTCVSC